METRKTQPSTGNQREALKESEKKANEKQPGSFKDKETAEKSGRDPAERSGQEADPRARFVAARRPGSGQAVC